jgi:DNA (cytosine-5)-methyltransferase 1
MLRSSNDTPLLPFPSLLEGRRRSTSARAPALRVVGLFAGVGGVELGLRRAGHETELMCEIDEGARAVLQKRFSGIAVHDDVTTLKRLPGKIDLLTGGFPCQDLSQAGKTAGILDGSRSGLVTEVFRLVKSSQVPWVLLENVPFMLKLDQGRAMEVLADAFEALGYNWAYRVVNSLAFGVPQRRERVMFLASLDGDPRDVLFADEVAEPTALADPVGKLACGFYWTEGLRGLGWATDAVPTLKGGSTIGIPSPPAILFPDGRLGTPDIRDAERMQGFPSGWTSPANKVVRDSCRWKMVGNAVTVDVFHWIGRRLRRPDLRGRSVPGSVVRSGKGWPVAGWNVGQGRYGCSMSAFPTIKDRPSLEAWLNHPVKPLSERATAGFLSRAEASDLRFPPRFLAAVRKHLQSVRGARGSA